MTSPAHHESTEGLRPRVGTPVRTNDGTVLGEVKEVTGEALKVSASMARDYWLSLANVRRTAVEIVDMDFDADVLDDYKLDGPVPATSEIPALDGQADTFSSETEKDARRALNEQGRA